MAAFWAPRQGRGGHLCSVLPKSSRGRCARAARARRWRAWRRAVSGRAGAGRGRRQSRRAVLPFPARSAGGRRSLRGPAGPASWPARAARCASGRSTPKRATRASASMARPRTAIGHCCFNVSVISCVDARRRHRRLRWDVERDVLDRQLIAAVRVQPDRRRDESVDALDARRVPRLCRHLRLPVRRRRRPLVVEDDRDRETRELAGEAQRVPCRAADLVVRRLGRPERAGRRRRSRRDRNGRRCGGEAPRPAAAFAGAAASVAVEGTGAAVAVERAGGWLARAPATPPAAARPVAASLEVWRLRTTLDGIPRALRSPRRSLS